jgi:hypothetical protein
MKCWNAAFNAQGWIVFIIVVQVVGVGKIYVAVVVQRPGKSKEGMKLSLPPKFPGNSKEGMKLSLLPKLVEKLVWVPVISFCKISFPVTHVMPYYAGTGRSRPLIAWV